MTDERTPVRSYSTQLRARRGPRSRRAGCGSTAGRTGSTGSTSSRKNGEASARSAAWASPERRAEQGNLEARPPRMRARRGDYDDPTAVLTRRRGGRTSTARRRVFSRNPTERVLPGGPDPPPRTRCSRTAAPGTRCSGGASRPRTATPRSCAGTARSATGQSLQRRTGAEYGVEDGDLIEATIDGNVLKGFINGVEVITADGRHLLRRAPRASGSTSASVTPTSTTDLRTSRSTPTTTECQFDAPL